MVFIFMTIIQKKESQYYFFFFESKITNTASAFHFLKTTDNVLVINSASWKVTFLRLATVQQKQLLYCSLTMLPFRYPSPKNTFDHLPEPVLTACMGPVNKYVTYCYLWHVSRVDVL